MSSHFSSASSFTFKERAGRLNWQQIQEVDLNQLIENGDVKSLQSLLENITYASLSREDLDRFGDASLTKLFKLSQLSLEYLQRSQSNLHSQVQTLDSQYKETSSRASATEASFKVKERAMSDFQREAYDKERTLATYELLLRSPQTAMTIATSRPSAFKCSQCNKQFISQDYLDKHMGRRHTRLKEPAKTSETMMEMLQALVSQNAHALADSHTREVESLKLTFDRHFSELYRSHEQLEAARPQFVDSYRSPVKEEADQGGLSQEREEPSQLMRVVESQRVIIDRLTHSVSETNARLILRSEEVAKAQTLRDVTEERARAETQELLDQELTKQRALFETERSYLEALLRNATDQPTTPLTPLTSWPVMSRPQTPTVIRADTPVLSRARLSQLQSNAAELEIDLAALRSSLATPLRIKYEPNSVKPVETAQVLEHIAKNKPWSQAEDSDVQDEVFAARSRRVELGAELRDSVEFEEIQAAEEGSVEEAGKLLGIEEAELIYIAADYLRAPMPEGWERVDSGGQVYYRNQRAMITYTNPNLENYRHLYTEAKAELVRKCSQVTTRIRMLLKKPSWRVLTEKYPEGVKAHFEHFSDSFAPVRGGLWREFKSRRSELEISLKSSRLSADLLTEFTEMRSKL
jgi:hypothetical protein